MGRRGGLEEKLGDGDGDRSGHRSSSFLPILSAPVGLKIRVKSVALFLILVQILVVDVTFEQ